MSLSDTIQSKRLFKTVAGMLGIIAVLGAVYVMYGRDGNGLTATKVKATAPGEETRPVNSGHMTAFVIKKPTVLPDLAFQDGAGRPRSLKDWRGKMILVNLWATWCGPCRREMPSLVRLDKAFAGQGFDVVAVSIDRKGIAASGKFLAEIGAEALGLYADKSGKIAQDLKAFGLPVSVLVDREGREIGRLTGPAEWDSEDAKRLIRAALAGRLKTKR